MAIDLRTAAQKKRDALHQQIIGEFVALRGKAPEASDHRRMCLIAERHSMTSAGIRRILVENKVL